MAKDIIEELGLDQIKPVTQQVSQEVTEAPVEATETADPVTEEVVPAATEVPSTTEEGVVPETVEGEQSEQVVSGDAPETVESEEDDPYLSDFDFTSLDSNTSPSEGVSPDEGKSNFNLNALSAKFGREFTSVSDVESYIDELRVASKKEPQVVNQPKFPGLSGEESAIVAEAVESGLIASEEVISGKLLVDYNKLHKEDRVYEWVAQTIREDEGREATHEEIQERVDGYDELQHDFIAKEYARVQNRKRSELMNRIVAQQQARDAENRRQEQLKQKEFEEFRSSVFNSTKEISEIAGTVTKVDDGMRQNIAKILTNPEAIKRLIWRDPANPDVKFAAQQVARLAFAQRISKDQMKASANNVRRELIEQESNITSTSDGASPITTQDGLTKLQRSVNSLDGWMVNG